MSYCYGKYLELLLNKNSINIFDNITLLSTTCFTIVHIHIIIVKYTA